MVVPVAHSHDVMMDPSPSRTMRNALSVSVQNNTKTNVGLGLGRSHSRVPTLPHQLHHSSSPSPAPLLRFPSHFRSSSSPPSSRPPTPILNALHEALTDSILPSPPPPARLAPSSHRFLSRPPPLISSFRYTSSSATPPTTSDSSVPSLSFATVSSPHSSLDTLRSIHTSAVPQLPPSPSLRRWWFQSDSDAGGEGVSSVLNESDLLGGNLGKQRTSSPYRCHSVTGRLRSPSPRPDCSSRFLPWPSGL